MDLVGCDEAGRGPVIGPMVMCGVLIDEKDEQSLKKMGVKDSKLLSEKQREDLFEKVKEAVKAYEIVILEPKDVDDALRDPNTNLNWLEAKATAEILNKLKPEKAIIDCPSNNPKAYKEHLRGLLKSRMQLVVEHKADLNYPSVAAASILAKVTRDSAIKKLRETYGDFGSGYPADPSTKRFLEDNWDKYPEIFRKTWASYKKVVSRKNQKGLDTF
ncbi:MAG: ribonuclease HII [Candidatus Nanoarchaeia archaeon]